MTPEPNDKALQAAMAAAWHIDRRDRCPDGNGLVGGVEIRLTINRHRSSDRRSSIMDGGAKRVIARKYIDWETKSMSEIRLFPRWGQACFRVGGRLGDRARPAAILFPGK
jgi:hypothetical protein